MEHEQKTQQEKDRNKVDKVGKTNVYPVSEMKGAEDDAKIHDEQSFGQGKRGAEGYNDSGASGIISDEKITNAGGSSQN